MKFKFKDHEDYKNQRKAILDKANALLADGHIEEANAQMAEVEQMDNEYEQFATSQANFNALKGIKPTAGAGFGNGAITGAASNDNEDIYNSVEYRKAFMNHVLHGSAIPEQFLNQNENTKTSDVGVVIPTTVMERIIEKMESTGMILPLITRTSYKGGLTIPTSSVKPNASWVTEGSGSDRQKKTTGSIVFNYYKLRCAVSVSLEVDTTSFAVFETTLINNVTEANIKAIEQAIINGDGSGKPTGILKETVVSGQNVDLAEGTAPTYSDLCTMEAKLPLAYENDAVWFMTKATFMKICGMVDNAGQPIARINYGIGGRPERTILGRTVILNDYMSSYADTVAGDTVIAFLFNPKDYVLNTNLNMTMKRYEDNDTDDFVTKTVMLVDGKVVDKNSLVTMTIKNS